MLNINHYTPLPPHEFFFCDKWSKIKMNEKKNCILRAITILHQTFDDYYNYKYSCSTNHMNGFRNGDIYLLI